MSYEIRILTNEEFDRLPYDNVKDSLGLTDTKRNVAFVRETGVRGMDEATINHEFDELMQSHSYHEVDGIRYKSGRSLGQIFAPVLGAALAPFTGGATIPLLAGAALGAGTSYHSSSVKPEKYGKPSLGNIALPAATGALGALGGSNVAQGAISGFKAADPGFLSKAGGALKGAAGLPTGGTASGTAISTPAGYSGTVTVPGVGSAVPIGQAASTASAAGTASGGSNALLNKFGSYGTNLATEQAVNALAPSANQSQETLYPTQRTPASNVSPVDLAGTEGALSRFNPEVVGADSASPISQEEYNLGINRLRQNKQTRISDLFQTPAFRGQTPEENTALAQQLESINTGSASELERYNQEIQQANLNREYDAVLQANSLTPQQMNEYIDLAQKSDAEIAARVQNDPEEFRAIFGRLPKRNV